ncbi:YdcF family protein [Tessaracoccus terricola]
MSELDRIADAINTLGDFCGVRDLAEPTRAEFRRVTGLPRADVLLFFGGTPVAGLEVLAQLLSDGACERSVLVGGQGHTTPSLRAAAAEMLDGWDLEDKSEAEIYAYLLNDVHMMSADFLERESSNIGENVTKTLELLERNGEQHHSYLLVQDATLQRRMHAVLQLHQPDATIVDYAAYRVRVVVRDGALAYDQDVQGIWPLERYVSMLLGEVSRLRDDATGHGPRGKGWLAHVDIPAEVEAAVAVLTAAGHGPRPSGDDWWGDA